MVKMALFKEKRERERKKKKRERKKKNMALYNELGSVPSSSAFWNRWRGWVLTLLLMFGRILLYSHAVLDFCLLGVF